DVIPRNEKTGLSINHSLGSAPEVAGYHGAAARHRLEIHICHASFVLRRRTEYVGSPIEPWELITADEPGQLDIRLRTLAPDTCPDRARQVVVRSAHDLEPDVSVLRAKAKHSLKERAHAFVLRNVSHEQHGRAHFGCVVVLRRMKRVGVDTAVDHVDGLA